MLARDGEDDQMLLARWQGYVRDRMKPCWEIDFCPFGPLVEEYPLLPWTVEPVKSTHEELTQRIEEFSCDSCGRGDDVEAWVIDGWRGDIERLAPATEPETIPRVFLTASCKVFGHMCPVYFLAEKHTETDNIRSNTRHVPPALAIRVARRDNYACQICGKTLLDKDIEFDHIIPLARGGVTKESNLRVTCQPCNRAKGKKPDHACS
ncbi:MAG: HNH endonuclease [Coriobacteriia bacterium]